MVGFPMVLNTKQDWINAADYAKKHAEYKNVFLERLEGLKTNVYMNVLKKSSIGVLSEEQTPEDYESVINPNAEITRLGFTESEIDQLMEGLV